MSLWSSGFFLTIPGWLQLTSAGSFRKKFLLFAHGCEVLAVPWFLCLCNIPINYLFSWLSLSSVPKTPSNGEIVLYPSSLVSHKKFLVYTEEAALYIIQCSNRAAEWDESSASQPLRSYPCWQELTRRGTRKSRDFLQVGDVCVPAVFGLQSACTPVCETWICADSSWMLQAKHKSSDSTGTRGISGCEFYQWEDLKLQFWDAVYAVGCSWDPDRDAWQLARQSF